MLDLNLWQDAPLNTLTAHIRQRYHDTHRTQLQDLLALAEKVQNAHAESFPADLLPHLHAMQDELLSHMQKEERILFPMLDQGMARAATMPIRVMMHEHTEHASAIELLHALTQHFTAPEQACTSWRSLYRDLQTFANDLNDHMQLENEVLFARALANG